MIASGHDKRHNGWASRQSLSRIFAKFGEPTVYPTAMGVEHPSMTIFDAVTLDLAYWTYEKTIRGSIVTDSTIALVRSSQDLKPSAAARSQSHSRTSDS
jgi:hypothetical protein